MLTQTIAVVSESKKVSFEQVAEVAAALQKQVERDFRHVWDTSAVISAYASIDKIPTGYWPIKIVDEVEGGTLGLHHNINKQPAALVAAGKDWPFIASHECLEMIVDPWGSRVIAGESIEDPDVRVEYLVEVCDPVQDHRFGYPVNGFMLSDFYTPRYFDPVASSGTQYSFKSRIKGPREILENGYLTWRDPRDNLWYQASRRFDELDVICIGKLPVTAMSIRHWVDLNTDRTARRPTPPKTSQAQAGSRSGKMETAHRLASAQNALLWTDIGKPGKSGDAAVISPGVQRRKAILDPDDTSAATTVKLE